MRWIKRQKPAALQIQAEGAKAVNQALANEAPQAVITQLKHLAARDAERIGNNLHFAALDRWLSLIYPDAESILDYATQSGALMFIEEPLRFRNRADAAQADLDERVRGMLIKGQAPACAVEAAFGGVDVSRKIDRIRPILAVSQIVSSGNGLPGAEPLQLLARPSDGYRGRENQLWQHLKDWSGEGKSAWLFAGSDSRKNRLEQLALEQGVRPHISAESLSRGFVWPAAGLSVIGTQDLFGAERPLHRHRRHEGGIKIDLFSDLVPGELVVHDAHGIGRYDGLANMDTRKRRDYLKSPIAATIHSNNPWKALTRFRKYVALDDARHTYPNWAARNGRA